MDCRAVIGAKWWPRLKDPRPSNLLDQYTRAASPVSVGRCLVRYETLPRNLTIEHFERQLRKKDLPLHTAVRAGSMDECASLLRSGADVEAKNSQNAAPLQLAAFYGHSELCRMLIKSYDANVNAWAVAPLVRDKESGMILPESGYHLGDGGSWGPGLPVARRNRLVEWRNGTMAIHVAARRGHAAACKVLIEVGGADINTRCKDKYTPLHFAALSGSVDVCRLLLEAQAVMNDNENEMECTPLGFAANEGNVAAFRLLVEHGADVNVESKLGFTALHYAAHIPLLDYGDRLVLSMQEVTQKRQRDKVLIARMLIEDFKQEVDMLGASPLWHKFIPQLETPLHHACRGYMPEMVAFLIEAGAELNTPGGITVVSPFACRESEPGCTPLHIAALGRSESSLAVVAILLEAGADASAKTAENEHTPLHYAVQQCGAARTGSAAACALLVKAPNVDVNAPTLNHYAATPLLFSAADGTVDCCRVLIEAGADPHMASGTRLNTPLHAACGNMGAHFDPKYAQFGRGHFLRKGQAVVARMLLEECGVDVNAKDYDPSSDLDGKTALHYAAFAGFSNIIEVLTDQPGVDLNSKTKPRKMTPLMAAVCGESVEACCSLCQVPGVDLNARADLRDKSGGDKFKVTAMHCAATQGNNSLCIQLAAAGADCRLRDANGDTPSDAARDEGHEELARHLENSNGAHFVRCSDVEVGCSGMYFWNDKSELDRQGWRDEVQSSFLKRVALGCKQAKVGLTVRAMHGGALPTDTLVHILRYVYARGTPTDHILSTISTARLPPLYMSLLSKPMSRFGQDRPIFIDDAVLPHANFLANLAAAAVEVEKAIAAGAGGAGAGAGLESAVAGVQQLQLQEQEQEGQALGPRLALVSHSLALDLDPQLKNNGWKLALVACCTVAETGERITVCTAPLVPEMSDSLHAALKILTPAVDDSDGEGCSWLRDYCKFVQLRYAKNCCVRCDKQADTNFMCSKCHSVCYCSKECQAACLKEHKALCKKFAMRATHTAIRAGGGGGKTGKSKKKKKRR
jgi:ankyrin repeat protein